MQLELGRVADAECWREVLEGAREVASVEGLKEVSYQIDVPGSVLSNALSERERHALKAQHLPYFVRADRSGRIIAALAKHGGYELQRSRSLTPEERLARYEEALSSLPVEIARLVRERAFGRSK